MTSAVDSIRAIQVLDSRGNPTVAVKIVLEDGSVGEASVPSGASTGEFEAVELRDGQADIYGGKGVGLAVGNVNKQIKELVVGSSYDSIQDFDRALLELDGTKNKQILGANAVLGASLAYASALAKSRSVELFELLSMGDSEKVVLPVPLVNVINGGAHANNSLDIQEFMIVPIGAPTFSEAVRYSTETFHALGGLLKDDGYVTAVGDEGGYAPRLESMDMAFDFLIRAIEKAGFTPGEDISLALDVAASELVSENGSPSYHFARSTGQKYSSSELISIYEDWCERYPIISIEDGLDENDWDGWKEMTSRLGSKVQLVGDDLFVTNSERLQIGIETKAANSVLVKVNQIGSLYETLDCMSKAAAAGYTNVVSHRSGETSDTTISDLAVGTQAGQIKTGSMCRGERTSKYNRLLWIEALAGDKAQYAKPF